MANNENLDFKKRSVNELLEQFNTGPQLAERSYPNAAYSADSGFAQQRGNLYFPDQFPQSETRNTLPFVFNTREDVMPTMVGMGGGNFMVYGTPNVERNVPNNVNYVNKTNVMNNYPVDYPADYTLFSRGINSSFVVPESDNNPNATPHLIDNLVGHWGSDQSGTYSPFPSCVRNVHGANFGEFGNERTTRKPRMVAEVRPMRPSYSDVLSKSVSNQKPGKSSDNKPRATDVKKNKSSVGRSLSGNTHSSKRDNLPGGDDQSYTGSNTSLKTTGAKKMESDEPLIKKWVSLDDLSAGLADDDFLADAKIKKNSPKQPGGKKGKENWEVPNGKPSSGKCKKPTASTGPKVQPETTKERETTCNFKFEPTRIKLVEERKAQAKSESKIGRRNSRGVQVDKNKKGGRGRKRDLSGGWYAVLVNRADLIMAFALKCARWLISLVLDVFALSTHLALYMCSTFFCSSVSSVTEYYEKMSDWITGLSVVKRIMSSRFWPFRRTRHLPPPSEDEEESDTEPVEGKKKKKRAGGLKHNLPLPSTGEEAMKRLLACKGLDPYSILGVSQNCTDDDIKKYYKRQAFLVHPDKNNQPGAEEAFKILVHAFDRIGEPEHRKSYDLNVEKTAQAEHAWSELSDLLAQLHKKMEYVANTLRCVNCGKRHKRSPVNRPIYAARMCSQCKIHHSVREGDIWAETSLFGFMWRYFACINGAVYDISEWAACQGTNLKNFKANTHQVQYRIVLGKHAQNNRSPTSSATNGEPDLEDFINNLYSKPESTSPADVGGEPGTRNRKHKRKK